METKPGYLRIYFEHHPGDPGRRLAESLIEAGVAQGTFGKGRDVHCPLTSPGRMTDRSYQWYTPGGEPGYHRVADELLDIFLHGSGPAESSHDPLEHPDDAHA